MMREGEVKPKWKPGEEEKVLEIRDRLRDKEAMKNRTIMINMLPMAKPSKKCPKPKSPTVKSPTEKVHSPIERITSPTFKTSKKTIKKYAPLMAQCMKIAKSKSCG